LDIHYTGGEVGGDELGAGEPGAGGVEEGVGFYLDINRCLRPGIMPDMEKPAEGAVFGEGDVALEEEFCEGAGAGRFILRLGGKRGAILQEIVLGTDLAGEIWVGGVVIVAQVAKSVGQAVEDGTQQRGQAVV